MNADEAQTTSIDSGISDCPANSLGDTFPIAEAFSMLN